MAVRFYPLPVVTRLLQATSLTARRCVAGGVVILVGLLSLTPGETLEQLPSWIMFWDKASHFAAYAVMAGVVFFAFSSASSRLRRSAGTLLFCAAYGVVLEVLQSGIPSLGRTFSLGDIVANTLGVAVMVGALCRLTSGNERYSVDGGRSLLGGVLE